MRRLLITTGMVAFAAFAGACGQADVETPVAKSAAPVINGVPDDASDDQVVLMETDLGNGSVADCTGSLVAHEVVVTARHCVSKTSGYATGADFDPSKMSFWLGAHPTSIDPDAHGAKIIHDGAPTVFNHDLAIVILDRPIGTKLAPLRLNSPPSEGEKVRVVGYGLTQLDDSPPNDLHARYRRDDVTIVLLGPYGSLLGDEELELGESICEGDSGGPVMDQTTGALLAVTSRGTNGTTGGAYPYSGCVGAKTVNIFARIDGYAQMITDAITSTGEQPWLEGQATPPPPTGTGQKGLGEACSSFAACASGLCIDTSSGSKCSQACDASTPCPSGFACTDAGGTFVCAPSASSPSKGGCTVDPNAAGHEPAALALAIAGLVAVGAARRRRS